MTKFYIKDESDQLTEATDDQLEEAFRERSNGIVAKRIKAIKDETVELARKEFEPKLREELKPKIEAEVRKTIEAEFQPKIDELTDDIAKKDVVIRQKAIAAEYKFPAETESFLGEGSDDEMRAKADILKNNFASSGEFKAPDKKTIDKSNSIGIVTKVED